MDAEKDLLKQDLAGLEEKKEIEKFVEDAELLGHEDIAEMGRKKLQEISEKANEMTKTTEAQTAQVESMGGNVEDVTERTKEVDKQIEEVKAEVEQQITEVQNQGEVKNVENEKQVELNKLRKQIDSSLDSSPDILASLCREHQKMEKEVGEDTFFVKNTVGQYVLKNFDKFSKDKLQELVTEFLNNDPSYLDQIEKNGVNENVKAEVVEEGIKGEKKEIVGENYPISLDYVGKHFEEKGEKPVDYTIDGKVMLMNGPDSGFKDVLTVPISWGNFRSINWQTESKPVLYKETEGYEKFQTISKKIFFNPDNKELFWIDEGPLGKQKLNNGNVTEMVAMMEEAYSKLKSQETKEIDLESFTQPFEEHKHTVEISNEGDYHDIAIKLKKLGYTWNGNKDIMEEAPYLRAPYKLIIEDAPSKIVTYIKKGSTNSY